MGQAIMILGVVIVLGAILEFIHRKNKYDTKLKLLQTQINELSNDFDDTSDEVTKLTDSIKKRLYNYKESLMSYKQYSIELENISNTLLEQHNSISQKIFIIADFFEDNTLDETTKIKEIQKYITLIQNDIKLNNELAELLNQQRGQEYER